MNKFSLMGQSRRAKFKIKEAVPPVPLLFTYPAVDALTFYMGVRNRPIEISRVRA